MIVCQCAVISDRDIELAVSEIMSAGRGRVPSAGVGGRLRSQKLNCCTCAPVAVTAIYAAMDKLAEDTRVCPYALAEARAKLVRIEERREERQRRIAAASLTGRQRRPRRRVA